MPQPLAIDLEKTPWIIPSKILLFLKGIISINMIYKAYWNFKNCYLESLENY